ncbi:hypothetical protein, partial [Bacillus thuringiensis]|uniref:hypothetical protein n=1 Tax=Bacillus thuringiensis TaxID=1428 RepID=UPI001C92F9A5
NNQLQNQKHQFQPQKPLLQQPYQAYKPSKHTLPQYPFHPPTFLQHFHKKFHPLKLPPFQTKPKLQPHQHFKQQFHILTNLYQPSLSNQYQPIFR